MKLTGDEILILWIGKPKPVIFKYRVPRTMDLHIAGWLKETFKGFGVDYYYSNTELYFRYAKQETLFRLRWQ